MKDVSVVYGKSGESKQPLGSNYVSNKNGVYEAKLSGLDSFTSYEFAISGSTSDGKSVSYTGIATTRGYPVEITVSMNGDPVVGAKISILGYEYTTDKNGKIYLELPSGDTPVKVTLDESVKEEVIVVKEVKISEDKKASEIQKYTIDINGTEATESVAPSYWLLIIPVIIFIGFIVFLVVRRRRSNQAAQTWTPLTSNIYPSSNSNVVAANLALENQSTISTSPLADNLGSSQIGDTVKYEINNSMSDELLEKSAPPADLVIIPQGIQQMGDIETTVEDGLLELDHDDNKDLSSESIGTVTPTEESLAQTMLPEQFPKMMGESADMTFDLRNTPESQEQTAQQSPEKVNDDEPEDIFEEAARSNRFSSLK